MIVCADDYGLANDIDEAILHLCGSGKLTAVSCMAALERCGSDTLQRLLQHGAAIDVGLHLCLTEERLVWSQGARARARSYWGLLGATLTGRLKPEALRREAAAQYDLFVSKCGRVPDFIDGHLHAHQLPGVREGLVAFVLSLPSQRRPYIRNTAVPMRRLWQRRLPWAKASLIGTLGATMRRRLSAVGIQTNQGFAGVYDFRKWRQYAEYLPSFVSCLNDTTGMLVVHPGQEDLWRRQEYESLKKFAFTAGSLNRFPRSTRKAPPDQRAGEAATSAMPLPQ